MLEVFAREAGPTAARLERETPVRWQPIAYSDYHAQRPGGRPQGGRTLEPKPIDPDDRARELVRDAPNVTAPVTYVELATGEIDKEELARRAERGTLTLGRALLAGARRGVPRRGRRVRDGHAACGSCPTRTRSCSRRAASSAIPSSRGRSCAGRCSPPWGRRPPGATGCAWRWPPARRSA